MTRQRGFVFLELLLVLLALAVVTGAVVTARAHHQTASQPVAPQAAGSPSPKQASQIKASAAPAAATPALSGPAASAAPTPVDTATPAQTPAPIPSFYELYRISSDGQSAQESPVTATLNASGNVKLTVNLQCSGACQFQLVSDDYPLSAQPVYSSSQTIVVTLFQHGIWYFYNKYTPNTKFGIRF